MEIFLECQVPNFSPPIRSRTSDRRGRACITSHVGVGRLGTLAYNSFRWRAIRIFNQLPRFLRNTTVCSVYSFKKKLDLYLSTVPDIPCTTGFNNSLDHGDCLRWSEKWLMRFNTEKCKVLHFGHNNTQQHYFMKDSKLSTTKEEKDFGVLITDNLKPSSQCTAAVNKTMSALRWSKRSFHYLDIESFRILYKTYIRPNLEFVIQAWSPYLDKDIKIMADTP